MEYINSKTTLCAIIGSPVEHSLSPIMHNEGFKQMSLNYVYTAFDVDGPALKWAMDGVRALGIRGLSVTIPHKTDIMHHLDDIDETARKIGAVNTVINEDGILRGYNTDYKGAALALKEQTEIRDKKVLVLGAGGAARGVVFGIKEEGAGEITILNRSVDRAEQLAREMSCSFGSIGEVDKYITNADIIYNTTSSGMYPHIDETPLEQDMLGKDLVVADAVFNPFKTKLIGMAEDAGCKTVLGYAMLLWQGAEQFKMFTGRDAPIESMRNVLLEELK